MGRDDRTTDPGSAPDRVPSPEEWDRLGVELDRHAARQRRLEVPTALGIVAFGLLIAVLARRNAPGLVLAGWLVAIGLLLLAPWVVHSRARHGRSPHPAPRLATLDGRPATVLPADRTLGYAGAGIVLVTAVWLLGTAATLGTGEDGSLALLLAVLGMIPLGAGWWLVRRARRVGIWLTAEALVVRAAGRDTSSRTAWALVREVNAPVPPGDLLMLRRVTVPEDASSGRPMPGAADAGVLFVRTGVHAIDGAALAAVIREYALPGRAAEIGTAASLGTIARIAATVPADPPSV